MTAPARSAAYRALQAIESRRLDLPAALARARERLDDERDRGLAAEIVTGTLRWRRSLDFLIEQFARRTIARLDAEVATVLRLSMYQLLHLDRVPASAVVDDAVDLVRAARKPSAAGFANAVLRSMLRQRHRLPLPARPDPGSLDAQRRFLGIALSHPDWLVDRWLSRHGFEAAEAWARFNNETPALTLRVNTLRATVDEARRILAADGVATDPAPHAPHGLVVTAGNPLRRPPDGLVVVQDEASQLVPLIVDPRTGERVLDLCASPGGKTVAMAGLMRDSGTIVASDVRPRRMALLARTIAISGARSIGVRPVQPAGPLPFEAEFDRVLVDAPCSGLGTIRRDPDIRWRRAEADLPRFAAQQLALLTRAAATVREQGRLVYATCSSEPEENEQVVDAFLAANPAFALVDLSRESLPPAVRGLIDGRGMFRTLPFRDRLEAFFAAALRRGTV